MLRFLKKEYKIMSKPIILMTNAIW